MDGGRTPRRIIPNIGTRSGSIKKFKVYSIPTKAKAVRTRQNIIATPKRMELAIRQDFTRALYAPEGA